MNSYWRKVTLSVSIVLNKHDNKIGSILVLDGFKMSRTLNKPSRIVLYLDR